MSSELPPVELSESERRRLVTEALKKGEELRQAKRLNEGIDLLIEALQYGVDKAQVYYRLGNLYFDAQKIDHAEYAYRKAIEHEPNHVNAHHNLSVVFRQQGKLTESVRFRKKAASLARHFPEQVQLSPQQIEYARGYAKKWMVAGLFVIGVIILAILLLGRG
jgi:tetratricopeptide (TPR) repeat protein